LEKAAKTKIDLAKAYEKLDAVMTPHRRIEGMLNFLLAQEHRVRTDFIQRLAKKHEEQKKGDFVTAGHRPHTAVARIVEALEKEEAHDE
jgi:hypothetical protein